MIIRYYPRIQVLIIYVSWILFLDLFIMDCFIISFLVIKCKEMFRQRAHWWAINYLNKIFCVYVLKKDIKYLLKFAFWLPTNTCIIFGNATCPVLTTSSMLIKSRDKCTLCWINSLIRVAHTLYKYVSIWNILRIWTLYVLVSLKDTISPGHDFTYWSWIWAPFDISKNDF